MVNPCEIVVPQFESITFADDVASITPMNTLEASSSRVKCADNAYPTEKYLLVVEDIEDTGLGCGAANWIGSTSLSNYV